MPSFTMAAASMAIWSGDVKVFPWPIAVGDPYLKNEGDNLRSLDNKIQVIILVVYDYRHYIISRKRIRRIK